MLRACSRAQHRPDSSMGAPDWPPPANSRAAPPRKAVAGVEHHRPARPFSLGRQIRNQRPGLDLRTGSS